MEWSLACSAPVYAIIKALSGSTPFGLLEIGVKKACKRHCRGPNLC